MLYLGFLLASIGAGMVLYFGLLPDDCGAVGDRAFSWPSLSG